MEDNRIGIIYCPRHGEGKAWNRIKACLDQKRVQYDFVQSENAESVERLATMLTTNGYRTIVVVGGDSALNRALRGIMAVQSKPEVALGVIPNGRANDFAHFWGLGDKDYRKAVDTIAAHRLRRVDVGVLRDATGASRPFLNCVNVGLASRIIRARHRAARFGVLRFVVASLLLLTQRINNRLKVRVNSDTIHRPVLNLCIGSAHGYGLTPNAVPYSGLLDVSVVSPPPLIQMCTGLWLLFLGRFLNFKNSHAVRTRRPIHIDELDGAPVSLDGTLWPEAQAPLTASLMPEHINFIIPQ